MSANNTSYSGCRRESTLKMCYLTKSLPWNIYFVGSQREHQVTATIPTFLALLQRKIMPRNNVWHVQAEVNWGLVMPGGPCCCFDAVIHSLILVQPFICQSVKVSPSITTGGCWPSSIKQTLEDQTRPAGVFIQGRKIQGHMEDLLV